MPRRKTIKKSALKRKTAEKRVNLGASNSYKSLFYGIATVIVLFIIGFGAIKLLINRPTPAIDNQAVSIQNLTSNSTNSLTETISISPTTVETSTPTAVVEKKMPTPLKQEDGENKKRTYVVKEGESLWDIAEDQYKDGYKWTQIAKANNIENPGTIFKGDNLVIPQEEVTPTPPPYVTSGGTIDSNSRATQPVTNKIVGSTYVVKHGDDLWDIALRAYGDGYKWVDIARFNNLANPDLIHSDNILKIPR